MNNSKVRIYDLSKELNLENKDILEICNQLNVSVKSHSSTITESDAERIRVAAEKYPSSHHGSISPAEALSNHVPKDTSSEKPKQEILAIHHKHNRAEEELVATSTSATLVSPPIPSLANQPNGVSQQTETVSMSPSKLKEPPKPRLKSEDQKNKEKITHKSKFSKTEVKGSSAQTQEQEAGNRPRKPKPVKKSDNTAEIVDKQSSRRREKETSGETISTKKDTEKIKSLPKLHRPQRPSATEVSPEFEEISAVEQPEVESDQIFDLDEELIEKERKPKLKLKRPSLPRTAKAQKLDEEEEEEEKKSAKVSKGASKGKRRQLVIEDDEDFESELENVSLPTSISLSIARPPKPKSMSTTANVADNSTSKLKKAAAKNETASSRTEHKEKRRERKGANEIPESIVLSSNLTIRELSEMLNVAETEIIKRLFFKGMAVNITQTLDYDTACLVAEELGVRVETEETKAAATKETEMLDVADLENLQRRPPVVTIMGHVDHGKTTLLDSIRKTKVAQGEAGGITQHIGAYHVDIEHDDKVQQIVFLDTPGHEAFTAMRARGARVTDIAVLVVAADDGVRPQTREAISHARAAEVPIVVAINKMDKPGAEPERVKQELTELGLVAEEWGGDTIMVPVSALKGENLDTLLEMILLVSEIEELSANPDRFAKGTVIEAHLDRSKGPVASLLIQNGTLRVGDIIVAGSVFGKIRAMLDDRGEKVEVATPSFAVEVLGINDVPAAGDEFDVFDNEKEARILAESRLEGQRHTRLQQAMSSRRVSLSTLSAQAQEGELKELNLILKADVQGSIEAIMASLQQLPQNEVQIRVLLAAPGEITETDVDLAAASGAVIVGFNTTLATGARQAADREGVDIREYNIIYKLLDEIQGAMEGLLDPEEVEEPLGQVEVRAVFAVGRGAVAGCYVQSGKVVRNRLMRVRRGGEIIYEGAIDSLKRIKEDVREVNAGYECGIGTSNFHDWQEGDLIEVYQMVMKRRTLSSN